jgi:hypothetical protein
MVSDANRRETMGRKLVAEIVDARDGTGAALVRIQWDAEWEEFRVSFLDTPGTYHTTSRMDALETGMHFAREHRPEGRPIAVCRKSFGGCGEA